MLRTSALLLVVVLAGGCATTPPGRYWSEAEVVEYNRHRILQLELGMLQERALQLMTARKFPGTTGQVTIQERTHGPTPPPAGGAAPLGYDETDTRSYERRRLPIKNPVRKASHKDTDGHWLEAYFFFTRQLTRGDGVTDAETTPLVFKDGELIGWGWDFYTERTGIRPRR